MPAVWFRYELTPITVKYTERRQPVYHFITMVSMLFFLPFRQSIAREKVVTFFCIFPLFVINFFLDFT